MSAAPAPVTPLQRDGGSAPIEPDFAAFARLYDEGVPQVAWTRLVADLDRRLASIEQRSPALAGAQGVAGAGSAAGGLDGAARRPG